MGRIAGSPVCGSGQNTIGSCPPRAAGAGAGASWGYAGAFPPGLLAKTFVTVVTLLASSRVLVDAGLATSVCPLPVPGPGPGRSAPVRPPPLLAVPARPPQRPSPAPTYRPAAPPPALLPRPVAGRATLDD